MQVYGRIVGKYTKHGSGWWFQTFFIFTPILGEMMKFHYYFSNGLKPPTRDSMGMDGTCDLNHCIFYKIIESKMTYLPPCHVVNRYPSCGKMEWCSPIPRRPGKNPPNDL